MGSYTRTGIMDCMLEEVVVCRATSCVTMPSGSMTQCNTWWASLCRFSVWQLTFINHKDLIFFFKSSIIWNPPILQQTPLIWGDNESWPFTAHRAMFYAMMTACTWSLCRGMPFEVVHYEIWGHVSLGSHPRASALKFHNALSQGIPLCKKASCREQNITHIHNNILWD